jgi:hypothetical protein
VARLVAILEDNPGRVAEMRACLAEALPTTQGVFFESAYEMISWLGQHLGEVVLISLDHDLPLLNAEGKLINCGDGRMVADFLASLQPACPVIVHSSNYHCAPGMIFALRDSGWQTSRIVPFEDHLWVRRAWKEQVLQHVRDGWIMP